MFRDLKVDMPALVTLIILSLFTFVIVYILVSKGEVTAELLQTLVSIVMLGVGFWLGSSSDSRKKTDAMLQPPPAGP